MRVTEGIARSLAGQLSPAGRRGRLAVFCYHQVLEAPDGYREGEPDAPTFARDIEIIASLFNVLPLPEAGSRLADGTLPARAACITFDDGYRNNHTLAAPILEAKGVPATIFIATNAIDDGVMWNDLVIEAMIRCNGQPDLRDIDGFQFESGEPGNARSRLRQILGYLKYLGPEERLEASRAFFATNVGDDVPRLMMSRDDVADLARRGFDIGGHTVNHPILKTLSAAASREEIEGCSRWIESVTGSRPATFAYPNGIPGRDFGPEHAAQAAAAGYALAVSTEWGVAGPGSDIFSIPRIGPWWRQSRGLAAGTARAYLRTYL